jgi:hypothetical protein
MIGQPRTLPAGDLITENGERWLPVVGFEGRYEVSDHGRVRSLDRVQDTETGPRQYRGKAIQPGTVKSGHRLVVLGKGNSRLVHALVLSAFVGPRPAGYDTLHGDGDPANNRLTNLRWGTRSENMQDAVRHGVHRSGAGRGEANPRAVLSEADVLAIRAALGSQSQRQLGEQYGVCRSAIGSISSGRTWSHISGTERAA